MTSSFTPNSSKFPFQSIKPTAISSIQGEVFLHLFYDCSTSNCGSQCHTRFDSQGPKGCVWVDVFLDVTARYGHFWGLCGEYMGNVWELSSYIESMIDYYQKNNFQNHIKVDKKKITSSLVVFFRHENYSIDFLRENESKGTSMHSAHPASNSRASNL